MESKDLDAVDRAEIEKFQGWLRDTAGKPLGDHSEEELEYEGYTRTFLVERYLALRAELEEWRDFESPRRQALLEETVLALGDGAASEREMREGQIDQLESALERERARAESESECATESAEMYRRARDRADENAETVKHLAGALAEAEREKTLWISEAQANIDRATAARADAAESALREADAALLWIWTNYGEIDMAHAEDAQAAARRRQEERS